MPIKCGLEDHGAENSLYAPLREFSVLVVALDHFYREVVDGNVPLTNRGDPTERWWEQSVVTERVNRYSKNWCLLFEVLAGLRERIDSQSVNLDVVTMDAGLNFVCHNRRGGEQPMEWIPEEDEE